MIMGISLVGVLTAAVASSFIANVQRNDAEGAKSPQDG
jgi:voltage-gated potassium channel